MTMDSGVLVENQNMGMFLKTISLKKQKENIFLRSSVLPVLDIYPAWPWF